MCQKKLFEDLRKSGAIATVHLAQPGDHAAEVLNEEAVFTSSHLLCEVAADIAQHFTVVETGVKYDTVVGLGDYGRLLASMVAYDSCHFAKMGQDTLVVLPGKAEKLVFSAATKPWDYKADVDVRKWSSGLHLLQASSIITAKQEVICRNYSYSFSSDQKKLIRDKKILIVWSVIDDVEQVRQVINLIRSCWGETIATAALCKGSLVPTKLPDFYSVVDLKHWGEKDCPLCLDQS